MSENVSFSNGHRRFIEWKATPKKSRTPTTQVLLAAELGLNDRTLTRWGKKTEVKDAISDRIRELLGDALPELYAVLLAKALTGAFSHLKMAFEMAGEYVEKHEVDATHTVSDDVLDAIGGALKRGYGE